MNISSEIIKSMLLELVEGKRTPSSEEEAKAFLGIVIDCINSLEEKIDTMSKLATPTGAMEAENKRLKKVVYNYRQTLISIASRFSINRRLRAKKALLDSAKDLWFLSLDEKNLNDKQEI